MQRMFSFLPPIACYALAATVLIATYFTQVAIINATGMSDSRVFVVGGIIAFLLSFVGFQRSLIQKEEANRPRVSSEDVLQKLSPKETGKADPDLNVPADIIDGPAADSPLGRVRARSGAIDA